VRATQKGFCARGQLAGGYTRGFGCAHITIHVTRTHTCFRDPAGPKVHSRADRCIVLIFSWRDASQLTRRCSACHVHALFGAGPPRLFVLLWPHPASPGHPLRLQHGRGHCSDTPRRPRAQRRLCALASSTWALVGVSWLSGRTNFLLVIDINSVLCSLPQQNSLPIIPSNYADPCAAIAITAMRGHACMPARDTAEVFSLTAACERMPMGRLLCDERARQETRSAPVARMLAPLTAAPPDVILAPFTSQLTTK